MSRKRSGSRGNHSSMWKKSAGLSEEDKEEIDSLFNKKFKYSDVLKSLSPEQGKVDEVTRSGDGSISVEDFLGGELKFHKETRRDDKLMRLKEDLNGVKDQLSGKDIETWHKHTTDCNLAGKILPHVKGLDVELCTQAWLKFYEILSCHNLVPDVDFLSVHLCEAPGAFIASLNHYFFQHDLRQNWEWLATTLSPYHEANSLGEMVADDRLIRLTHSRWFFGDDGSGDITAPGHVAGLCRAVGRKKESSSLPVLLVTADGSKDCQENPAEQEAMLSRLHYCEMVAACLLLEERGSFVLKVFTMFEDSSVVLMLLLNLMFEEVHGIKPATSKSGNSEMYLVCKGYRKNVTWKTLWDIAQATVYSREDLFLEVPHIPDAFLREHRLCCEAFARWQTGTMCRNMDLYVAMTTAARNKLQLQQEVALETFVKLTGIRYQKHLLRVGVPWREKSAFHLSRVSVHALGEGSTAAAAALWENKKLKGTFHLRQNLSAMSFHDRVRLMDYHDVRVPDSVLLCNSRLEDSEVTQWPRPECGDRPLHVLSSRICNTNLLEDFNTLLSHSDVQRHQRDTVCQHATMLADMLADKVQEYFSVESSRDPQQLLPGRVFCHQLSPSSQEHKAAPLIHVVVTECADQDSVSRRTFLNQLVKNDSVNVRSVSIDEQREMGQSSCDGGAVLFCDVIGFLSLKEGAAPSPLELVGSRRLLSTVLPILKTLPLGGHLVLLTTTFLTRLSSTLLYILARSFEATSLHGRPNLWAQQLLLLSGFRGLSPSLERHLTTAHHRLTAEEERGQSQGCLMELYSFLSLLNDRKFVQFLTAHNNYALAGLVNELLKLNKPPEEMAADGEGQQNLT